SPLTMVSVFSTMVTDCRHHGNRLPPGAASFEAAPGRYAGGCMSKIYPIHAHELASAEAARNILLNDPAGPYTLPRLSRLTGTNTCSLKRAFRALCQTSVGRYRTALRMAQARELLARGLSVREAAGACG